MLPGLALSIQSAPSLTGQFFGRNFWLQNWCPEPFNISSR